jgi:hypothetical protein
MNDTEDQIAALLNGLYFSKPLYWQFDSAGISQRIAAREIVKRILGITSKQAKVKLKKLNIPRRPMPKVAFDSPEVVALLKDLNRNGNCYWRFIGGIATRVPIKKQLQDIGMKINDVDDFMTTIAVEDKPFPRNRKKVKQLYRPKVNAVIKSKVSAKAKKQKMRWLYPHTCPLSFLLADLTAFLLPAVS